jgi:DNA sulfur modification protein DndE
MKTLIRIVALTYILTTLLTTVAIGQTRDIKAYLKTLPFEMPDVPEPVFQSKNFNIIDYGAISNGQTLNTDAFAKAITACNAAGGGMVIIPSGAWLTGPIEMKSNVNLHLEKGALVIFTPDHTQYPIIRFPGSKNWQVTPPVWGVGLENIAITGDGIMDGNGQSWRPLKQVKATDAQWEKTIKNGVVSSDGKMYWPTKEAMEGEAYIKNLKGDKNALTEKDYEPARDFLRPMMVVFNNCKNVLIDGPTIQNSPKFGIYPNFCENVIIRNTKVLTEWWAQNGDAIDISGGRNVLVYNCTINAGDDGICMKASPSKKYQGEPSLKNVVIFDCVVYHGHGGFVIGSNTDGGMQNISVDNCNFISTDIGIRVKSNRGRGGIVENIFIKNIFMKNIEGSAISFDTYYEDNNSKEDSTKHEVTEKTPRFRKFFIENVTCNGAEKAVTITGLPEMSIQDINLKNATIEAEEGVITKDASKISMNNVSIIPHQGPVFTINNSSDFSLDNISFPDKTKLFMQLDGATTSGIVISGTNTKKALSEFEFGAGVKKDAVLKK